MFCYKYFKTWLFSSKSEIKIFSGFYLEASITFGQRFLTIYFNLFSIDKLRLQSHNHINSLYLVYCHLLIELFYTNLLCQALLGVGLLGTVPGMLLVRLFNARLVELSLELFVLELAFEVSDPRWRTEIREKFPGIRTLAFVLSVGLHARPEK